MVHFTEKEVLARMRSAQSRVLAVLEQYVRMLTMKHAINSAVFSKEKILLVNLNRADCQVLAV
tara:strand:- start:354 stop:542 length:189 start_codon:yes stop_codon:yes gene_type:complete